MENCLYEIVGPLYSIKMCISSRVQCFTMESQRQNFICDERELPFTDFRLTTTATCLKAIKQFYNTGF